MVHINVKEITDEITLHSKELKINNAKIFLKGIAHEIDQKCLRFDDQAETINISVPNLLQLGSKAILEIRFTGVLNDSLRGFYRTDYTIRNNEIKWIATTHFEPTFARYAFPCFDEPEFKSTFSIALNVRKGLVGLSNGKVKNESYNIETGMNEIIFEKSPIMSTYLVAFVVGEFDYIEGIAKSRYSKQPIRTRIYTPPGQKESGKFSLSVAIRAIEFFENTFEIPYTLPKIDHIAINKTPSGAMENWGLIIYKKNLLLLNDSFENKGNGSTSILEEKTGDIDKKNIVRTICHELAHQWLGNIVTMKWWSDLWLNEGLATWAELLCVDSLFSEWNIWAHFLVYRRTIFLDADSKDTSNSLVYPGFLMTGLTGQEFR
ncbi:Puromycin-sensitive aminopeptidase [Smittium culicis]|uniref:Puromycin-sensitive aminopeptidase n=1 Tax=Smittium culicis TaxID=133412 RepID=A0A1R1X5X6_9FUNG|nr:Puromycin-sensitive aminopeptidase [Smittium culicis]